MAEKETKPASIYVPVTLNGNAFADGTCRALLVETAGRANLTQSNGTIRENVPLVVGYNPIKCKAANTPTSGDAATGVWALYE